MPLVHMIVGVGDAVGATVALHAAAPDAAVSRQRLAPALKQHLPLGVAAAQLVASEIRLHANGSVSQIRSAPGAHRHDFSCTPTTVVRVPIGTPSHVADGVKPGGTQRSVVASHANGAAQLAVVHCSSH